MAHSPQLAAWRSSRLAEAVRHQEQGEFLAALLAYDEVLACEPENADIQNNRGNTLLMLGRLEDALASFDASLRLAPQNAITHFNRANTLRALGRVDEAIRAFERALQQDFGFAEAHLNLALSQKLLGQLESALGSLDRALQINPNLAAAHNARGIVLIDMGRWDEALAALDQALRLRPNFAKAHTNRARVLRELGLLESALNACDSALRIQPELPDAHNTRGFILQDLGKVEDAIASYSIAIDLNPGDIKAHSNRLLALNYRVPTAAARGGAALREFSTQFNRPLGALSHSNSRRPDRKLRIGYVSGDLRCHPVSFFLRGVLASHDHDQMEIFCYATHAIRDDLTDQLQASVDHWITISGLSDVAAADRIRLDGIDLLVDLSGHTAHHRLLVFAKKPAPVQVTWLGYSGTTGLDAMDYILADRFVVLPGMEELFTEYVWRLPMSYLCFKPPDGTFAVDCPAYAECPLSFGSFNNVAKLSPDCIGLWAEVLHRVPNSRLVLKDKAFSTYQARGDLLRRFQDVRVSPSRLRLVGAVTREEHFRLYNEIDVALDSTPYGGTTTTTEALWMGVPVVTLSGETWVSRVSESILRTIGIPEWVATDENQYAEIAASLAATCPRGVSPREQLRTRVSESVFCNCEHFTRMLETAYRAMWRRWCSRS